LLIGEYVRKTGVDAVALDTVTDPAGAMSACPEGTVFQGNLDPLLMRVGGEALRQGVLDVLAAFRGRAHIFNLGHGITPDVNPDHVALLTETVRGAV
jgi:uroporphyrinogen decarboxylase